DPLNSFSLNLFQRSLPNYCVSSTKKRERFLKGFFFLRIQGNSEVVSLRRSSISGQESQYSSFLTSKETEISISGKEESSQEPRKDLEILSCHQNITKMPLFVLSKSSAKKSQTFISQEQQGTSPMNTDEAFKSHHCFWKNPNYLESTLSRRYQSNFSLGSQRFSGQFLMIPNPEFVDISSMTNSQDTYPASFQPTNPKIILKEEKENEEQETKQLNKWLKKSQQYWTIKKELTKSNVAYGTCRRLTLPKSSVEEHILKHLLPEDSKKIDKGKPGITVKVYDHDTDTEHELCLAFQRSYVLKNGWVKTFIKRRGLEEGDKIGLFWECSTYKLHFSVLSRVKTKAPA
ncbi:unnamed protein product, partial [Arabidopsis halleri]